MESFAIRGFNPCESLLRHTPEQLRRFIRRMKTLKMNTIIIHYDYGWTRYKDLILEECAAANIKIILMTFGPRSFLKYSNWRKEWFAKNPEGQPYSERLECETYPCRFQPEALEAYAHGAREWLKSLPPQIKHVHMRAADGIMFCQCEKCRVLTEYERWQPFVDIFADAVMNTRPDLDFETDIYVKRYHIPGNRVSFQNMKNIMYDTFYRTTCYPIGSTDYQSPALEWAKSTHDPDTVSLSANHYHFNRMKEWNDTFPGKVYVHENTMAQNLFGIFTHSTSTNLKDLEIYRKMGIQGVCYEAYEPSFINFEPMFNLLAKSLNGEEVEWEKTFAEDYRREHKITYTWQEADEPAIEKIFPDPVQQENVKLYYRLGRYKDLKSARAYMKFLLDHKDTLDYIFAANSIVRRGLLDTYSYKYRDLTPVEKDLLTRRKLWDFMEDIPLDQDPIKVCEDLMISILDKAEE